MVRRNLKTIIAVLITCLSLTGAYLLVIITADYPVVAGTHGEKNRKKRAAIMISDKKNGYDKLYVKMCNYPYLQKYYHDFMYLGQHRKNNREKQRALLDTIASFLEKHEKVDLYFMSHGWRYHKILKYLPYELTSKIRLVYNTGCGSAIYHRQWLALGADTYISHVGKRSASPIFYTYFFRRWVAEWEVDKATKESNKMTYTLLTNLESYIPQPNKGGTLADHTVAKIYGNLSLKIND